MRLRLPTIAAVALLLLSCGHRLKEGEYTLTVLTTNDVHGKWFDSTYVGRGVRPSLVAVKHYVDSVRRADGEENVLLLDAGDCLQGDNAAYYYNYVDTLSPHLFPRLVKYMGYDAVAVGNHDLETGHRVYDRVQRELVRAGIPFLGGNVINVQTGRSYFPLYTIVQKGPVRVAVIGYENANIQAWLGEELWSGMRFETIVSRIQKDVDFVRKREQPQVVIVVMHSATGQGDGASLEAEALDAFNLVKGADLIVCGHDHRPYVETRENQALLNAGSHARYIAKASIRLNAGKDSLHKAFSAELIPVNPRLADSTMREAFRPEYEAVKAFTVQEVGTLEVDLRTRDAYTGMSPYVNLLHTLQLSKVPEPHLSLAAPLTFNGEVPKGVLTFNDLFTIYPFENQLYAIRMTGEEVVRALEASYNRWIQNPGSGHVLRIIPYSDPRTRQEGWSFEHRSYNFDSAGGLVYTVDVTRPFGSRVQVQSLADGTPFSLTATYNVGVTSYRANGGGGLLDKAGVNTEKIEERIVGRYEEIRNILYDYLQEHGSIDPEVIGDPGVIGSWKFVPEKVAGPALKADIKLLFPR